MHHPFPNFGMIQQRHRFLVYVLQSSNIPITHHTKSFLRKIIALISLLSLQSQPSNHEACYCSCLYLRRIYWCIYRNSSNRIGQHRPFCNPWTSRCTTTSKHSSKCNRVLNPSNSFPAYLLYFACSLVIALSRQMLHHQSTPQLLLQFVLLPQKRLMLPYRVVRWRHGHSRLQPLNAFKLS